MRATRHSLSLSQTPIPQALPLPAAHPAPLDLRQLLECRADLVWNKPFPSAEDGTMQRDIARLLPRLVRPDGERGANGAESARAPRTPKAGFL